MPCADHHCAFKGGANLAHAVASANALRVGRLCCAPGVGGRFAGGVQEELEAQALAEEEAQLQDDDERSVFDDADEAVKTWRLLESIR